MSCVLRRVILQLTLVNLARTHPTMLNGQELLESKVLNHNDVFTIADRSFRIELPRGVLQPVSYFYKWLRSTDALDAYFWDMAGSTSFTGYPFLSGARPQMIV